MSENNVDLQEMLQRAKKNDETATRYIINQYSSIIKSIIAKGYFLKNGDRDDLFQEGLIGLSRAIKDFDPSKGNSETFQKNLESFFYMCVQRSIISAIKTSNRKKNSPLNDMSSLDRTLQDNENLTMMDVIASKDEIQNDLAFEFISPELQLIAEETKERYQQMLEDTLSDSEKSVYNLRKEKHSYKDIQTALGYDKTKPIDNALQRIKVKMQSIIEQDDRDTNAL